MSLPVASRDILHVEVRWKDRVISEADLDGSPVQAVKQQLLSPLQAFCYMEGAWWALGFPPDSASGRAD